MATGHVRVLRWSAIAANVGYCALVLLGTWLAPRGMTPLWQAGALLPTPVLGLAALLASERRSLRRWALRISLVIGVLVAGSLLFLVFGAPVIQGARRTVFVLSMSLMAAVPLLTALVLGKLQRLSTPG